jgi:hypothetical protein
LFLDIKRLGEVIIRTQFEAPEKILFLAARGKQKHIELAESLANLDAFHPGIIQSKTAKRGASAVSRRRKASNPSATTVTL